MPYSLNKGVHTYYEIAGEGEPMVLVHANPFDHRLWLYQAARFSDRFRTINVDMRGYGRSDKPVEPFTLQDIADDVIGVCRAEGIRKAIFCGISTGSGICLLIGQDHPEIVRALVLVGGSTRGPARMQKRIDGFLSRDIAAYHAKHLRECVTEEFANSARGRWLLSLFLEQRLVGASVAQIFRARMTCDLARGLGRVQAPTLVVNGERDMSLPAGAETAAGVAGARHIVIPGAGHCCNLEKPEEFDSAVVSFLTDNGLWVS